MKALAIAAVVAVAATLSAAAQAHPRGHYWGPGYYPRYSFGFYFAPPLYYGPRYYPAPYAYYYPAPPLVVERSYVEAPPPPPPEPRYRYEERSRAQVTPPPPQPAPATPKAVERVDRYTLSATELFEFDKATLRMPQPKLDEIAAALARDASIGRVTITGYTDRLGSDEYNLRLSQRRAAAVKDYLVRKGVAASRLEALGKGKANPVVECHDADRAKLIKCLEPNRRVEVERITVEVRR